MIWLDDKIGVKHLYMSSKCVVIHSVIYSLLRLVLVMSDSNWEKLSMAEQGGFLGGMIGAIIGGAGFILICMFYINKKKDYLVTCSNEVEEGLG